MRGASIRGSASSTECTVLASMVGARSCRAVTTPGNRDVRKGTRTRPPTTGVWPFTRYVNVISRGTGRATSQKEEMRRGQVTGNRAQTEPAAVADGSEKAEWPPPSGRCCMQSGEAQPQHTQLPHRPAAPVLSCCPLFPLFWHRHSQVLHHHLQILPGFLLLPRIAEQVCRVVGHGELCVFEVIDVAAQVDHRIIHTQQRFGCDRAQRNDDLRLHDLDLPHQEWRAGVALFALRSAVPWRTAFNDVRDVDVLAPNSHCGNHVVEQLAGASDKRLALYIFVCAWCLTDKHDVCP